MITVIILRILTGVIGLGFFVSGIYTLFGLGWALLAAAGAFFTVSEFIRKGLASEQQIT